MLVATVCILVMSVLFFLLLDQSGYITLGIPNRETK